MRYNQRMLCSMLRTQPRPQMPDILSFRADWVRRTLDSSTSFLEFPVNNVFTGTCDCARAAGCHVDCFAARRFNLYLFKCALIYCFRHLSERRTHFIRKLIHVIPFITFADLDYRVAPCVMSQFLFISAAVAVLACDSIRTSISPPRRQEYCLRG